MGAESSAGGRAPKERPFLAVLAVLLLACALPVLVAAAVKLGAALLSSLQKGDAGVEALLFEGNRLLVDGDPAQARRCFETVLSEDRGNVAARVGRVLCDAAGAGTPAAQSDLLARAAEDLKAAGLEAPYRDFLAAEAARLAGDQKEAQLRFDSALAECGELLRYDILHRVDHTKEWAATPRFCLALRFPLIPEIGRVISRFSFRPFEAGYLTLYVCSAAGSARLVFPREGTEDDRLQPAGACLLVEFFVDSGEWVVLPGEEEVFVCGLATAAPPDRAAIKSRLTEILAAGSGRSAAAVLLEKELGPGRAVCIEPQPIR